MWTTMEREKVKWNRKKVLKVINIIICTKYQSDHETKCYNWRWILMGSRATMKLFMQQCLSRKSNKAHCITLTAWTLYGWFVKEFWKPAHPNHWGLQIANLKMIAWWRDAIHCCAWRDAIHCCTRWKFSYALGCCQDCRNLLIKLL